MAWLFQVYYLHVAIFIGCLGVFTWLFRGEIVEKTLHYHFLAPMRREWLDHAVAMVRGANASSLARRVIENATLTVEETYLMR